MQTTPYAAARSVWSRATLFVTHWIVFRYITTHQKVVQYCYRYWFKHILLRITNIYKSIHGRIQYQQHDIVEFRWKSCDLSFLPWCLCKSVYIACFRRPNRRRDISNQSKQYLCPVRLHESLRKRIEFEKENYLYHITKTRLFKYIEIFTSKNRKFSNEKIWYFSYSCSKHRLWVLVRTAPPIHNLCFWAEVRKIIYIPVNPNFTVWKWGLWGSKLYSHVCAMVKNVNEVFMKCHCKESGNTTFSRQ